MRRQTGSAAIVAARADEQPVDTEEIRALTEAAGYEVRGAVTQARAEDPGTHFGRGKVADLSERVAEAGGDLVAVDGELTPRQTAAIREALPEETAVFDRYRLVLAIFADRASTRRAQLQTELARLRYDLPRLQARSDVQGMSRRVEKGTPLNGVKNRIADLERKLDDLPHPAEQHRAERREQGFDLVTLAGYTNAGKSTLLRRLADDLAPEPVPVSVREGTNLDRLRAAVAARLPTEHAELRLPNGDEGMAVVSRAYDRAVVESVEYGPETVALSVRGRPAVVERLRADAEALGE